MTTQKEATEKLAGVKYTKAEHATTPLFVDVNWMDDADREYLPDILQNKFGTDTANNIIRAVNSHEALLEVARMVSKWEGVLTVDDRYKINNAIKQAEGL
jgi:hypothetical protein